MDLGEDRQTAYRSSKKLSTMIQSDHMNVNLERNLFNFDEFGHLDLLMVKIKSRPPKLKICS